MVDDEIQGISKIVNYILIISSYLLQLKTSY